MSSCPLRLLGLMALGVAMVMLPLRLVRRATR